MDMLDPTLMRTLEGIRDEGRPVCVLTGAGISAESGIPTFRGSGGFWRVGSAVYKPEEFATWATFSKAPELMWPWYLWRRAGCLRARPNAGHQALVALERALGDRFQLVTQNIDSLHRRAGQSEGRMFEIHGCLERVRCSLACTSSHEAFPAGFEDWTEGRPLDDLAREALTCSHCGAWLRPHVLWFDEYYDEENYRFESTIARLLASDLLIVVGTTGATNLAMQMGWLAAERRIAMVNVDLEDNTFARLARGNPRGHFVQARAGDALPLVSSVLGG